MGKCESYTGCHMPVVGEGWRFDVSPLTSIVVRGKSLKASRLPEGLVSEKVNKRRRCKNTLGTFRKETARRFHRQR